jgi:hypothetical protein
MSMSIFIETRTGSTYEFADDLSKYRRLEVGGASQVLRQDGEWLDIISVSDIAVGEEISIIMPVLDPPEFAGAQVTYRTTSEVVRISGESPDVEILAQGQIAPA